MDKQIQSNQSPDPGTTFEAPSGVRRLASRVVLFLLMMLAMGAVRTASATGTLTQTLTVSGSTTVLTGEQRTIEIGYSWASLTANLSGGKIVVTIPATINPDSVQLFNSSHVQSSVYDKGAGTITFNFIEPLGAGSSGTLKFTAGFANGTTADGTTAPITAQFSGIGAVPDTDNVTLTASASVNVWFNKEAITNPPSLDNDMVYMINLNNQRGNGSYNIANSIVSDVLPVGVNYVASSHGGTYNPTTRTVSWNLGVVNVYTYTRLYLVVQYASSHFSQGNNISNTATWTGDPPVGAPINLPATSNTVTIGAPNPGQFLNKTADPYLTFSHKGSVVYYINMVNTGNVNLNNYTVIENLPKEVIPWAIYLGSDDKGIRSVQLNLSFKTNQNSNWRLLDATTMQPWAGLYPGSPFTISPATDPGVGVGDIILAPGEVITSVKWEYPTLPVGYESSWRARIGAHVCNPTTGFDRNGDPVGPFPVPIRNTVDSSWTANGIPGTDSRALDSNIIEPSPIPEFSKWAESSTTVQPRDVIDWNFDQRNSWLGSKALKDPVYVDLLHPSLEYVENSENFTTNIPNGAFTLDDVTVINDYNGSGRQLVKFSYLGEIPTNGPWAQTRFKTRVKAGAPVGWYTNDIQLIQTDNPVVNFSYFRKVADTFDLDGDGNITEEIRSTEPQWFNVIELKTIDSVKWVKGELDTVFHRYPDHGYTNPVGALTYKMIVTNPGNVPLTQVRIMDILPYVGDTGVLVWDQPRLSDFPVVMTSPVVAPAGVTVKYSSSSNPDRTDLDSTISNPPGAQSGTFSATVPGDLSTVKSLLFDFGSLVLAPGESRELVWDMNATTAAQPGMVAWNSFAQRSESATDGSPVLPSEPIKVGIGVPASIGSFVWEDLNGNGLQDSGEPGIPGATVRLLKPDGSPAYDLLGNPLASATTDGNGFYFFGSLLDGSYVVRVTPPAGYLPTPNQVADVENGIDSDSNIDATRSTPAGSYETGVVVFALGTEPVGEAYPGGTQDDLDDDNGNMTVDFGFYRNASLGNLVFVDANNNGVFDSGESGLNGVTVVLDCDLNRDGDFNDAGETAISSQVTSGGGFYHFPNLLPGNYRVRVPTPPVAYALSSTTTNTNDDQVDNDDNGTQSGGSGAEAVSPVITISSNEDDPTVDFGFYSSFVTVGNFAWLDANYNGIQDSGESGLAGVTVTLFDAAGTTLITTDALGNPVAPVITDSTGSYLFGVLPPGQYTVKFTPPAGYFPTVVGAGSSADDSNGLSAQSAVLPAASSDLTLDSGFVLPVSVGDFIWSDLNRNGIQDAGEPGVAGAIATLYNAAGTALVLTDMAGATISPITTTATGSYLFANLPPGQYTVMFTAPSGYVGTLVNASGSTPANDSNGLSAQSAALISGQSDLTLDTGYVGVVSVGDYVWLDTNGNGTQDTTENGLAGATATLYDASGTTLVTSDASGNPISPITTTASGAYLFSNLPVGQYTVKFTPPAGYFPTIIGAGSGAADSNGLSAQSGVLVAGQADLTLDSGFVQPVSVGDFVWLDTNSNGIQDGGEPGLAGVIATLYDASGVTPITTDIEGKAINPITTPSSGAYLFANLSPGQYMVKFTTPVGYAPTITGGGTVATDSNGLSALSVVLESGQSDTTLDSGFIGVVSVGDFVWLDVNHNGIQDSGESGLAGATATLFDASGVTPITTDALGAVISPIVTPASGLYLFSNLPAGQYTVKFTAPAGYTPTLTGAGTARTDSNGLSAQSSVLTNGQSDLTLDSGFWQPASLGDYVWADVNKDGMQNDDPAFGINGLTVELLNAGGAVIDTTVTANDGSGNPGYYLFGNLLPGTYSVRFTAPAGQVFTYQNGTLASVGNSDADRVTGQTAQVTLAAGDHVRYVDAGVKCPDTWADWKLLRPGALAGANLDGDAYDNFAEYAFAMPDNGKGSVHLGHTAWIIRPSVIAPGTLEAVFVRPTGWNVGGGQGAVTYSLQYASAPGNPTVWSTLDFTASSTVVDNGDCTETVTIHDLEALTGLTLGTGTVRIVATQGDTTGPDPGTQTRTEVEGWKETPLDICCRTYSNPYLREMVFTGTVSTVSGQSITFAGQNLDNLVAGSSYFLEVVSGDNEGHRFDIVTTSGSSVTLATDASLSAGTPPFNTLVGALPASLAGDLVVIRRHWTLGEIFPATGFLATGSQSSADQVQIFAGGAWTIYWLYDLNDGNPATARWVDAGDSGMADKGSVVVPPGQGMFFNKRVNVSSILAYGEVRDNDFIRPLAAGSNLVSGGYPIDQSANNNLAIDREMNLNAGFFGSRDFKTADSIFVWNTDTVISQNGYSSYYLLSNAPTLPAVLRWVKVGDASLLARDSELLMLGNRSVFLRNKNAIPAYKIPSPWTP